MSGSETLGCMKPILIFFILGFLLFLLLAAYQLVVLVVLCPLEQTGVLHLPHPAAVRCCTINSDASQRLPSGN